jgi:ABC-type Co2+ transport system permease subunit
MGESVSSYDRCMMKWLANYVFLASWLSVIIALIAMLLQARRTGTPLKWSKITLRLGFLICLSAILTPSVTSEVRSIVTGFGAVLLGVLIVRSAQE